MRTASPRSGPVTQRVLHVVALVTVGLGVAAAGLGCVQNPGLMVIVGNQIPTLDSATHKCSPTMGGALLGQGVLDLGVGSPQGYVAYPVVQNRLSPRGATGGFEPNRVMLAGFRVTLNPPPGYVFPWPADVSNHIEPHFPQGLEPSTSLTATVEIVSQSQAKAILNEFRPDGLNPDLTQQIIFTAEIRAVGQLNGSEIESDVFRFPLRMCVGCLQTGFTTLAQYNYPGLPLCSVSPRPNMYKGNACHFAQDSGPLLCCLDENQRPVCPAPDL